MALVKNLPANAGGARDTGLIPGLGRSPGGRNGNPLQYSYLEMVLSLKRMSQLPRIFSNSRHKTRQPPLIFYLFYQNESSGDIVHILDLHDSDIYNCYVSELTP